MSRTGGILLVLGGAVGFATLPLFAKWGHAAGLDATSMNAVRLAATAAILFAWVALSSRETARVAPRDLAWLVLFGALDCALSGVLYFTALATLDASLAHMLIFTFPAMVAVLARLVYGEPLTAARVGAVLLSFAGSALVVGRASLPAVTAAFLGAVGLVLAAALILALYHVVVQGVLARHRPIPVVAWMAASGALALALYDAPRLGAARAALVATIEPFVTVVLAGLLFGERFTPGQWLGGGLIVAAIVLAQGPAPQGDPLPAAAAAPARAAGD